MEAFLTPRVFLLGLAAAATAGFGVVVLAGNRSRNANRFLAGFLFLIAGNHVAEFLRSHPAGPAADVLLYQVASVFAALDPLLLYYFASIYPERNSLNDTWKVGAVTGVSVVLAAFSVVRAPPRPGGALATWGDVLWGFATVGIYLVVLVSMVRRLDAEGAGGPVPLLVAAMAVVTLPAVPRPLRALSRLLETFPALTPVWDGALVRVAALYGPVPVAAALLWWFWASEDDADARRALRASLAGGLGLTLLIYPHAVRELLAPVGLLQGGFMEALITFSAGTGAALRWIAFSALVSQAIVRHDMLGMSLKARRRTARTLVATGVAGAAGVGLVFLRTAGMEGALDLTWADLFLLGSLAALTQGFHKLIDGAAHRFYGVPPPGDEAAAMEVYREAVEQAAAEGRDVEGDETLRRLEDELGLEASTARTLREIGTAGARFDLAPGREVAGRYEVTGELDDRPRGSVYLAWDELLDRDVVLKEIRRGGSGDEEGALAEARTAGSIQHPNILTVYDVLESDGSFVLVTEHAAQGSLAERVRADGPLDLEDGVRLLEDVLSGLEAVHQEGVVHRDVKPSNVLLTDADVPKVADFGVAQVERGVSDTFDEADVLAGTPAYMAPEQQKGELATPRTDIYAVGRVMGKVLPSPLPPGLREIQERALEDAPEDRWPSAAALRDALHEWRRSQRDDPTPVPAGG